MSALLGLSFRHVPAGRQMPYAPTNEDRLRALRQALPPKIGNAYPWPHTQAAQYAAEQSPIEPIQHYADRRG